MNEMVRFALLGCGRIGRMHARHIAAHARAELVVCYDVAGAAALEVAGETGAVGEEALAPAKPGAPVKRVTNISKPTLTVVRPAKGTSNGASVIIAPGGGYSFLAWDLEGEEVAAWLNSIGVTGIILKYRVPRRPSDANTAHVDQHKIVMEVDPMFKVDTGALDKIYIGSNSGKQVPLSTFAREISV